MPDHYHSVCDVNNVQSAWNARDGGMERLHDSREGFHFPVWAIVAPAKQAEGKT